MVVSDTCLPIIQATGIDLYAVHVPCGTCYLTENVYENRSKQVTEGLHEQGAIPSHEGSSHLPQQLPETDGGCQTR